MAQNNGRVSLTDTVMEKLEDMITSMKPGERLPTENDLAEQFSVGRSTIRESMKVLAARRMVVRRNEGTFVGDAVKGCLIDPLNLIIKMNPGNDINALIELREILELNTVRMAAQRATAEDLVDLKRAQWLMEEPGISRTEAQQRDIQFHGQIAKIAGNPVIEELLSSLRAVIAQDVEHPETMEYSFQYERNFHQEIVNAISEQNPEKAVQIMHDYFDAVYKSLGV